MKPPLSIDGSSLALRWGLALVVAGLHGLAWVAIRPLHARPADASPFEPDRPPLQVMLLSAQAGQGDVLLAHPVTAAAVGVEPVPSAPPAESTVSESTAPERPALAVTAPDLEQLSGMTPPTAPIRLRLHIDAQGLVTRVDVLESAAADADFVQRLVQVLLQTAHIPARRAGRDVDSVKELVLNLGLPG